MFQFIHVIFSEKINWLGKYDFLNKITADISENLLHNWLYCICNAITWQSDPEITPPGLVGIGVYLNGCHHWVGGRGYSAIVTDITTPTNTKYTHNSKFEGWLNIENEYLRCDWISEVWSNILGVIEYLRCDWISEEWLNIWGVVEYLGCDWISEVRLNIWGVTQPGTGTWSPEDQTPSGLGKMTTCVTQRNNIKSNLRSKYKAQKYKKILKNSKNILKM